LSDVSRGGITAFPEIGIGIKPAAGSGVCWFNLDPDAERDENLVHAACLVVLGGPKWSKRLDFSFELPNHEYGFLFQPAVANMVIKTTEF